MPDLHRAGRLPERVTGCFYCDRGERLKAALIKIRELSVSTLYLFRERSHPGRCVVAYRTAHISELFALDENERNRFMGDVALAAAAVSGAVDAEKINYGAYGDRTPHLHFHVVPKRQDLPDWGGTFQMLPAEPIPLADDEAAELIEGITRRL